MFDMPLLMIISVPRIKKGFLANAATIRSLSSVHPDVGLEGLRLVSGEGAALKCAPELRHFF